MTVACPQCDQASPPGARFCSACGSLLERKEIAAPTAEGERRQITVLFCDMVGSTEMAARLDDEDYQEIVRLYQNVVVEAVTALKGHVAQYLGDGVVAYFGWPMAYGDDAERSVRAGLEILAGLNRVNRNLREDRKLAARIGIHTGRAILGEIGAGARRETTALGETPNIAARVQSQASKDTVVISEATNKLIGGRFVVEPLGRFPMKGVDRPMPLYQVRHLTGMRNRLYAPGRISPFVGRRTELGILADVWASVAGGDRRVVLIRGEPGIGKSRLVRQFAESLRSKPHTWIEGFCSPFSTNTPFAPSIDGLQHAFMQPDERPALALGRLHRSLTSVSPHLDSALPVVAEMLNIPPSAGYTPLLSSPEQKRRRFIDALIDWILSMARLQPLVALLEDIQWSDPSTLELAEQLIERSKSSALMLIYTARPEFSDPQPLGSECSYVNLGGLSHEEAVELARLSRTAGASAEPTVELFAERSGGVPLFVEELARVMAGRVGASPTSAEIPATLADLLMARLDATGNAKETAQIASILGPEFSYPLLRAVADQSDHELGDNLHKLVESDLILARGQSPETQYFFKHALIREVAYDSLLRPRRRTLHNAAAQALGDKSDPETLAYHHAGAGNSEAASRAWQSAGERAAHRGSLVEASNLYTKAIDALSTVPGADARDQHEMSLQMSQASVLSAIKGLASPEAEAAYNRLRELGSRVRPNRSIALLGLWQMHVTRGEGRAAQAFAEQRLEIAERESNPAALCGAHSALGMTLFHRGRLAESIEHLRQAVHHYTQRSNRAAAFDAGLLAMAYLAVALVLVGETGEARHQSAASMQAARELDSPPTIAFCTLNTAAMHWFLQESPEVLKVAREGADYARARGVEQMAWGLEVYAEWAATVVEQANDGPDRVRRAIAGWLANGQRLPHAWYLSILASVEAAAGRTAEALETLDEAGEAVGEMLLEETIVLSTRAEILMHSGNTFAARDAWHQTKDSAIRNGARLYEARSTSHLAGMQWKNDVGVAKSLSSDLPT